MSCQHPCQKVGWVSAVIKVHSAQKQSRASGSYLLCLRAYRKKKLRRAKNLLSVGLPQCPLEIARPEEEHRQPGEGPISKLLQSLLSWGQETQRQEHRVWNGLCWHGHQTQCICKALRSCHQQQTSMLAAQEAGECLFFCFFLSESPLKHHCCTIFPIKNVP